jgi:hypothetical protein
MGDLISVSVLDGKYTIQQVSEGRWECLRYGEHWPAMASGPDNLHTALAWEVDALRTALAAKDAEIARLREALEAAHTALMHYEWYANPKSGWALPENETLHGKIDAALAGGSDA